MIKYWLVLVTLNHFGHNIYHTTERFDSRSVCEVRRGQVMTHASVIKADCIVQDKSEYFSDNHQRK